MATQRAWEAFPETYRAEEMQMLARWILAGESGSIVGLPGCGRTNLLEFLGHRPEVLHSYLPPEAAPVALIPVDLNNLPASDLSTLYRIILRSFYWVQDRFDQNVRDTITTLYRENRAAQDPFLSQSALHELFFVFQAEQIQVVLILNRFDHFCQVATPQMLNTLRGLRDSFKETLSFIVGMRQEVAYWSDPETLGDMYELLDTHVCWVGPMNETDARQVIERRTAPTSPAETEIQMMLSLTGGFPVLLRAISYWWLYTTDRPPINEWPAALATERGFHYRLARLWDGLTQEEQFALSAVREWQDRVAEDEAKSVALEEAFQALTKEHGRILPRLEVKRLCRRSNAGWQLRGELLADYIRQVGPSGRGRIRIDEETEDIYQGLTLLRDLTPREETLLRFLIKQPYKRHKTSNLMLEVWPEDALDDEGKPYIPRDPNDLQQVISSLRKKIEVNRSDPRYIITPQRGSYQFYPEGRPK